MYYLCNKINSNWLTFCRLSRGIKTLTDLLKQANAGRPVSEEDIPPPVTVKKSEPRPAAVEPEPAPEPEPAAAPAGK